MNDDITPLDDLKHESAVAGKDNRTRYALYGVVALWLLTLATLLVVGWNAYFDQKEKAQSLAQQIAIACERGTFGPPDFTAEDEERLCDRAKESSDSPVVIEGPEGPQGPPGVDGVDGSDGTDGKNGRPGPDGEDGVGSDGQNGTDGINGLDGIPGETGATGPAGPPGPQGEQGPPGQDGTNGASAVPFTFMFTVGEGPLSSTYICTITQANDNVVCQEQE